MQIIGEQDVRIIPDIAVQSGQGGGSGMVDGLLGMVMQEQINESAFRHCLQTLKAANADRGGEICI